MSNIFCFAIHPSSVLWLLLLMRFFLPLPWHFPRPLASSYLHPASCLDITGLLFRLLPIHFLNLKALLSVKPSYLSHPFPSGLVNLSMSPYRQWPSYHWLPRIPLLASINLGLGRVALLAIWLLLIFWLAYYLTLQMEPVRSSESSVNFYRTLLCKSPEDCTLQFSFLFLTVRSCTIEPETVWMPTSTCAICLSINKSYEIRTWPFPKISGNKITHFKTGEERTPKTLCILNISWYKPYTWLLWGNLISVTVSDMERKCALFNSISTFILGGSFTWQKSASNHWVIHLFIMV